MAIWIVQWVGQEIRVLDYIEGVGQVLAIYVSELRSRGYRDALCVLPHDGINENSITGKRYADHLRDAGFVVEMVSNQGRGRGLDADRGGAPHPAALLVQRGDDRSRPRRARLLPRAPRRPAQHRLGPEHDWSSHAADAFGLMAISYGEPSGSAAFNRRIEYPKLGWM